MATNGLDLWQEGTPAPSCWRRGSALSRTIDCAGFYHTHIHFPQTEMLGPMVNSLNGSIPIPSLTELQFSDKAYADQIAQFFVQELLKKWHHHSLWSSVLYIPNPVDALFEAAGQHQMRRLQVKSWWTVMHLKIDNATDSVLIRTLKRWLKNGMARVVTYTRLRHAFAPTSTQSNWLKQGNSKPISSVYVHTHLSENKNEIAWVKTYSLNSKVISMFIITLV